MYQVLLRGGKLFARKFRPVQAGAGAVLAAGVSPLGSWSLRRGMEGRVVGWRCRVHTRGTGRSAWSGLWLRFLYLVWRNLFEAWV